MKAPARTQAKILAALGGLADAYGKGDARRLAALYVSEGALAFGPAVGEKWLGRKQIGAAYAKEFSDFPESGLEFLWAAISSNGGTAWVASDCRAHVRVDNKILLLDGRFSAVLVRKGASWVFAQTHFSFPTVY